MKSLFLCKEQVLALFMPCHAICFELSTKELAEQWHSSKNKSNYKPITSIDDDDDEIFIIGNNQTQQTWVFTVGIMNYR